MAEQATIDAVTARGQASVAVIKPAGDKRKRGLGLDRDVGVLAKALVHGRTATLFSCCTASGVWLVRPNSR